MGIRLICLALGYIFGLFQTAFIYGKKHGVDIRESGSGNAGTTNALRTFGKKVGLLVFWGDCLKCVFCVLLIRFLFRERHGDILHLLTMYGGLGCMLGHSFPFFMGFKGGKGMACLAGLVMSYTSYNWLLFIIGLIIFFGNLYITNYVSLGSLLVGIEFFVGTVLLGIFGRLGLSGAALTECYIVAFVIVALLYYTHRGNIERLLSGTERKTHFFTKGTNT